MNYRVKRNTGFSVISSEVDKINGSNAHELRSSISTLNKDNESQIIIDLSKTSYCDSSGLSAILLANRLCKNAGGKFILTGLQPNVQKLIKIAQLHRVLTITDSLPEAEEQM